MKKNGFFCLQYGSIRGKNREPSLCVVPKIPLREGLRYLTNNLSTKNPVPTKIVLAAHNRTGDDLGSPEMWVICFRGSSFSEKNLNLERSPNFSLGRPN
ncbi:MAG: hypothetical protein DRR19_33470 [Candidatus Parabeggiatoa sp. nov. 1]|nr:MAG: hypothetical protein DRR19_33470 [Gammaproteobacteria bacterium]